MPSLIRAPGDGQPVELAATALAAMTDDRPLPPWTAPSTIEGWLPGDLAAPATAHDAVYRIATHAGTLSESWYVQVTDELDDLAYVEIVGIASTVAAVVAFRRAAGLAPWSCPQPSTKPSRVVPPDLVAAELQLGAGHEPGRSDSGGGPGIHVGAGRASAAVDAGRRPVHPEPRDDDLVRKCARCRVRRWLWPPECLSFAKRFY